MSTSNPSQATFVFGLVLLWPTLAFGQGSLMITYPADGVVVRPGQTISVTVVSSAGAKFPSGIGIIGEDPLGWYGPVQSDPALMSVTIPTRTAPGRYAITAVARDFMGKLVTSPMVEIEVAQAGPLVSMRVQPSRLVLRTIGEEFQLNVYGTLSDGSTTAVSGSRETSYVSADAAVATVDSLGVVTAVAMGRTEIVVRNGSHAVSIPLAVIAGPLITVSATPSKLWPPNGKMVAVTVSGIIGNAGGGVDDTSLTYRVTDDYQVHSLSGTFTREADGRYSFTILLEASRRPSDFGGRAYTIVVTAKDVSGRSSASEALVIVQRDVEGDRAPRGQ